MSSWVKPADQAGGVTWIGGVLFIEIKSVTPGTKKNNETKFVTLKFNNMKLKNTLKWRAISL